MPEYQLATPLVTEWFMGPGYACEAKDADSLRERLQQGNRVAIHLTKLDKPHMGRVYMSPINEDLEGLEGTTIAHGPGGATWERRIRLPDVSQDGRVGLLLRDGPGRMDPRIHSNELARFPRWMQRCMRQPIDYLATWANASEREPFLLNALPPTTAKSHQTTRLLFTQRARGALYSRRYLYDRKNGTPNGHVVRIVLIETNIDRRGSSVLLHARFERHVLVGDICPDGSVPSPMLPSMDPLWANLALRAHHIFGVHCATENRETATLRLSYLRQRAEEERDAELNGTSFASRIEAMGWQEALSTVKEPWQLLVVADAHADQFAPDGEMTFGNAVRTMLQQYACSDSRRSELMRMVEEYLVFTCRDWFKPLAGTRLL